MKKQFLLIVSIVLLAASIATAQATPAPVKQINKGVLNGTAVSLARPPYPPAARAVRASGAVNVQVTIDEEGNVVSATALSGHPLLRSASAEAARQSKFSPTLLEGQPVKVTGIIVYNYIAPMSFSQIGYEIALAEKSSLTEQFPAANISGNIPVDWEEEKSEMSQLSQYLFVQDSRKRSAQYQEQPSNNTKNVARTGDLSSGNYKGVITDGSVGMVKTNSDVENFNPSETIKKLHSKIENRLSGDEQKLWAFKFGSVMGSIAAEIENGEKTRANIAELNRIISDAPPNTAQSTIDRAKEIVELAQQNTLDAEKKAALVEMTKKFRNF